MALNVCGLKMRLKSTEFEISIQKYDLICLTETKLSEIDDIVINGFKMFKKNRPKSQRASGGVALLVDEKSSICNCITDMCLKLNDTLDPL